MHQPIVPCGGFPPGTPVSTDTILRGSTVLTLAVEVG